MNMKNLKISEETHKRLKVLCAEHGFKINTWVDLLIKRELDRLNEQLNPKKKLS